MNEFYTVQELAGLLKVTPKTIYRMVERGDLPCHRIGRIKRFSREDVEAFLNRCRTVGSPTNGQDVQR